MYKGADNQSAQSRLVYSPGGLLHHSVLDGGMYVMLGFSVPPDWLKPMIDKMLQVEYLLNQVDKQKATTLQKALKCVLVLPTKCRLLLVLSNILKTVNICLKILLQKR